MYDCMYVCYLMSMAISIHIHNYLKTASSHGDICVWYMKTTCKSQYETIGLHAYKFVLMLDTLHHNIMTLVIMPSGWTHTHTHTHTHRSMHSNSVDKNDFTCKGHAHHAHTTCIPHAHHMHTCTLTGQ